MGEAHEGASRATVAAARPRDPARGEASAEPKRLTQEADILIRAKPPISYMAKRKGRRKYRRYLRGKLIEIDFLSTLAANTAIGFLASGTLSEKAWLSSVVTTVSWLDVTPNTGGPVIVGVAHSDYTAAEIESWVENSGSWNEGDKINQEIARRKIRLVGTLQVPPDVDQSYTMNDGMPVHTKCNWQLATGDTVKWWVYNQSSIAFATTNPAIFMLGHANLWPN